MVTIRNETATDVERREAMLDRVWGRSRAKKTAERLREGRLPAENLSFIAAFDGCVVGTRPGRIGRLCCWDPSPSTRRGGAAGSAPP